MTKKVWKTGNVPVTTLNFPKLRDASYLSKTKCKCGGTIEQTSGYDQVHAIDFVTLKCNKCGETNYVIT